VVAIAVVAAIVKELDKSKFPPPLPPKNTVLVNRVTRLGRFDNCYVTRCKSRRHLIVAMQRVESLSCE
jgi:hypothetical protein